MKPITWEELWPKQRLIEAEAAHSRAAKALTQAELALERIDQPSARCVAIQTEIDEGNRRYWDASHEERDLIDSRREQLEQALSTAEMEHENTRPTRLAALKGKIARRTDTKSDGPCL